MSDIRWQRVNDEPFEYAIQQGPHGDEFIKLLDGSCLRRALSPPEPTEGRIEAGALALLQQRTHPPVKALGRDLASDHARSEATTVLLAARALPLQDGSKK